MSGRRAISGHGLDYFPHHLARARRELPRGAVIPVWTIWVLPLGWLALFAAAASALVRRFKADGIQKELTTDL